MSERPARRTPLNELPAVAVLLIMSGGYALLARAGEVLLSPEGVSMFWPAAGFAAVMLLWATTRPRRAMVLLGIVIGSAVNVAWRHGIVPNEAGYLAANLIEPLVMLPFLVRGTSVARRLDRPASVGWLVGGAAVSTTVSATVVASASVWAPGGSGDAATFIPTFLAFGLGDVTGILIVVPLLLQATPVSNLWTQGTAAEQSVLWTLLVMSALTSDIHAAWIVASMMVLVLIALLLDSSAASLAMLVFAATVLWQWKAGNWPVAQAIDVRLVLVGVAIIVLSIALSTSQRRYALAGQQTALGQAKVASDSLSAVLDAVPSGIAMYAVEQVRQGTPEFRLSFMNRSGLGEAGTTAREVVGLDITQFYPEALSSGLVDHMLRAWMTQQAQSFLLDSKSSQSGWRGYYQLDVVPISDGRIVVMWRDITDIESARVTAEENWTLLRRALDSGLDAFIVLEETDDAAWHIAFVNSSGANRIGRRADELTGAGLEDAVPVRAYDPLLALVQDAARLQQPQQSLVDLRGSDSAWHGEFDVLVSPVSSRRVVVTLRDVTEMQLSRRALEAAHQQAVVASQHDALTGLPNRTLLNERLVAAQRMAHQTGELVAVVFLDIDAFKVINDVYGHQVGDHVLTSVASRLKQAIRTGDTAARLGGDEFVVVLTGITPAWSGEHFLKRLQPVLHLDVPTGESTLHVTVSAGYAVGSADVDPATLISRADAAMYASKAKRRGELVAYEQGMARPDRPQL